MNVNSQNFGSNRKPKTFNNPERFVEGWYWVLPSQNLGVGTVKPITILGKNLVIYRGKDKVAVILDAYCPHMGAHLAEGKVENNELRCFFHHWKFDAEGICVDIPCLAEPLPVKIKSWPTAEKYGLIWVWTGEIPKQLLPFVPELEQKECDVALGYQFTANCHPHVVIINNIDAQHFHKLHKLPLELAFEKQELNPNAISFSNNLRLTENSFLLKLYRRFSRNPINYSICYWYGSTSIVTLGCDFFHIHLMFAMRLLEAGKAEGQILFISKKRKSIFGKLYNKVILGIIQILGHHFIKGDSKIFETIKFDLKTPIKADQAIMHFVNHLERQKALKWGSWNLARTDDVEIRETREQRRDDLVND